MSLEVSQQPKGSGAAGLVNTPPVADSGEVAWGEFFSAAPEQRAELHQQEQHWGASALLAGQRGEELARLVGDWLADASDLLPETRLRATFSAENCELWVEHLVAEPGKAVEHYRLDAPHNDPSRTSLRQLHEALRGWVAGQPQPTRLSLRSLP